MTPLGYFYANRGETKTVYRQHFSETSDGYIFLCAAPIVIENMELGSIRWSGSYSAVVTTVIGNYIYPFAHEVINEILQIQNQ